MTYREIVHSMINVMGIHRYKISKASHKVGLYYGQPNILEYVEAHNYCTQKELAKGLHVSPASVATSVKRLEKSGYVTKIQDKEDTRKTHISITDNGKYVLKSFRDLCNTTDSEMFKGFTDEECRQFAEYLTRIQKNLNPDDISAEDIREFIAEEMNEREGI
ncbi:MAG: MarR family transcriptional regulator [Oscillospiraceae bacterium]|nr:MarR family transcriptional regulator [Oscillospiraceae bacterium]